MLNAPLAPIGFVFPELGLHQNTYVQEFAGAYAATLREFNPSEAKNSPSNALAFGNTVEHLKTAKQFGLGFIPVDLGNDVNSFLLKLPASTKGTVKPKRIVLFGCESTGKSQLAKALSAHFSTLFSEEYARTYFTFFGDQGTLADIPITARGQLASNNAVASLAHELVFFDTDLLLTQIWSEVLFGSSPERVSGTAKASLGDFYLLAEIDLPWVPEAQRCLPNRRDREAFQSRCVELLELHGCPYATIRSVGEERTQQAVAAVTHWQSSTASIR